jgi:myosin heavy subunit
LEALKAQVSEARQAIDRLQDENLELRSRYAVLDAERQLKLITRKDYEVRDLEIQLRQLTGERDAAVSRRRETEDELHRAREAQQEFDLRHAELEAMLSAAQIDKQELTELRQMCQTLQKDNIDVERLRASLQAVDLRAEQLEHALEESKAQNARVSEELQRVIETNSELTDTLSSSQVQTAQTDIINLKRRSQIVHLQGHISELESHVRALQTEKDALSKTIDSMNERHQRELEMLAEKVRATNTSQSDVRSADMLASLNRDHAATVKKLNEVSVGLRNEAAEHVSTKSRLVQQEKVNAELIRKFSDMETDHACLLKSIYELFGCSPPLSTMIATLSRGARRLQQYDTLCTRLADRERELAQLKVQPAQLRYELSKTESWLEIERRKNHLLETRARNQAKSGQLDEPAMIECTIHFLNAIVRLTEDLTVKSAATDLLGKADTDEFRDPQAWATFGVSIVRSTTTVRTRTRDLERRVLLIFRQLSERLTRAEDRFTGLVAKVRFSAAKRSHGKKSMIPRPAGGLYERSLKPRRDAPAEVTPPFARARLAPAGGRPNAQALPKKISPTIPRRSTPSGIEPPALNSFA